MVQVLFLFSIIINLAQTPLVLFKSQLNPSNSLWQVVDDRVMGGLSQGKFEFNNNGNALFQGYVTNKNNGGFSSVRCSLQQLEIDDQTKVVLKVKGDGKIYQFRLKSSQYQRHSYKSEFKTSGDWQTIELPLNEFYPSFRGYRLDLPNFESDLIAQFSFLIANNYNADFSLEIDSIQLQ